MVAKNPPDERVVYLKLKHVFKGDNAKVRQTKTIQKLLVKHGREEDVSDLIKEHNLDIICSTARVLLTEQIFESTLKAKIRFPEVFDVSPAQSAEREASEAEAARNEAIAIQGVVHSNEKTVQDAAESREVIEPGAVDTESGEQYKFPPGTRQI